jgi:hypothetical protein
MIGTPRNGLFHVGHRMTRGMAYLFWGFGIQYHREAMASMTSLSPRSANIRGGEGDE